MPEAPRPPETSGPPEIPDVGLLFDVLAANERVGALLRQALRPSGLTPMQYAVTSLIRTAGPATPSQICRVIGLQPSTLSGYLTALDRAGFARRVPGQDGRSVTIELTATGVDAHLAAEQAVQEAWGAVAGTVDVQRARAVLRVLAAALDAAIR